MAQALTMYGGDIMEKTMVELFAGVGGFRLGLEKHGWKTVWANQWEPSTKLQHAYEIYIANFGNNNVINEDINKINKHSIPNHTLLVGGFPCQDYSVARTKAEGIQGKKGVLWWNIAEILNIKRPKFVLLENVDRLIKSPAKQRGRDFAIMLRTFYDYGYYLEWRVINAAEYGFAQRRRRVFMFAAHETTNYYNQIRNMSLESIIEEHGFFENQFPTNKDMLNNKHEIKLDITETHYHDLVDISDTFKSTFFNTGLMIGGKVLTRQTTPQYIEPTPLRYIIEPNADESLYISPERIKKFTYLKNAKKEPRVDANGYKYFYSEGGMEFPDSLDKPSRTILTSETSTSRTTHVICDPWTNRLRLLSPIECEKLNGFPRNWTNPNNCRLKVNNKRRYFLMGNALVVDLIDKMGQQLNRILEQEE